MENNKSSSYVLAFKHVKLPARATLIVPTASEHRFCPGRLVIPDNIARSCAIACITVGTQNQFVQHREVPAVVFSESSTVAGLSFDTMEAQHMLALEVRNKSDVELEFSATVFGALPSTEPRRFLIGFDPSPIDPGATKTFRAEPQIVFRPKRLVVPSHVADGMQIVDITIGGRSQLANPDIPIASSAFSEKLARTEVDFDIASIGNSIKLVVRNDSKSVAEFSAAMVGELG